MGWNLTARAKRYGIPPLGLQQVLEWQRFRCAVCRLSLHEMTEIGDWVVDHDHKAGHVRGVLCRRCNTTLGLLGDELEAVLATASRFAEYIFRRSEENQAVLDNARDVVARRAEPKPVAVCEPGPMPTWTSRLARMLVVELTA